MSKEVQGNFAVYHEKGFVEIVVNGKSVFRFPYDAAKQAAKMINSAALKAEEYANANQMIQLQSTLLRAGFNLPVVNDPAIFKEAQKEARWNGKRRP